LNHAGPGLRGRSPRPTAAAGMTHSPRAGVGIIRGEPDALPDHAAQRIAELEAELANLRQLNGRKLRT